MFDHFGDQADLALESLLIAMIFWVMLMLKYFCYNVYQLTQFKWF